MAVADHNAPEVQEATTPKIGRPPSKKVCGCCCEPKSRKEFRQGWNVCNDCRDQYTDRVKFECRKKPCGQCGSWFYPRSIKKKGGNRNCEQCRYKKGEDDLAFVVCDGCGKKCKKTKQKRDRNARNFCSWECYLATDGRNDLTRQLPIVEKPKYWCKQCVEDPERRESVQKEIQRLVRKRKDGQTKGTWEYAVGLRLSASRHRRRVADGPREIRGFDASRAIDHLVRRSRYHRSGIWNRKVSNKLSNLRKRRSRKGP